MVRFEKLSATEKNYPFVDATLAAEYVNGTFGTVVNGVFTAGATGFYTIMNLEDGDDAKSDDYKIEKDAHARIADLSVVSGQVVNITAAQLPASYAKGDKLVSVAAGTLAVPGTAPTEKYLEVLEVTSYGCRAKIVK